MRSHTIPRPNHARSCWCEQAVHTAGADARVETTSPGLDTHRGAAEDEGSLGSRVCPGALALLGCCCRSLAARSRGEDCASRPELLWPMERQAGGHLALPAAAFPANAWCPSPPSPGWRGLRLQPGPWKEGGTWSRAAAETERNRVTLSLLPKLLGRLALGHSMRELRDAPSCEQGGERSPILNHWLPS